MRTILKLLSAKMRYVPNDFRGMSALQFNPVYYKQLISISSAPFGDMTRNIYFNVCRVTHVIIGN